VTGVLALQGDFAAHARAIPGGAAEVRAAAQVDALDLLVLPGGESTTMLKLLAGTGIEDAVRRLVARGGVVFGTCAGAILLARRVTGPEQPSWGLIDADVERNAFGRQVDSFEIDLDIPALRQVDASGKPYHAVFIRAPLIEAVHGSAIALSTLPDGRIVAARQGKLLATSFHPELTRDKRFHQYFLELVK
jgi:5'-phosphate synthase pdxT subunit